LNKLFLPLLALSIAMVISAIHGQKYSDSVQI